MRLLHILLLLVYCHFTMAGFAGAWVMKHSVATADHAVLTLPDPADAADDMYDRGDDDSPCDPDQCHRSVHILLLPLQVSEAGGPLFTAHGGRASLRPIDILTPPPRA